MTVSYEDRVLGSLLGGAIGDSLGAGVEFWSLTEIYKKLGAAGVQDFVPCYGGVGLVTDDTQMALFTLEGLLDATEASQEGGYPDVVGCVNSAYMRWLTTQVGHGFDLGRSGLLGVEALYERRAPGNTCLGSLYAGGNGSLEVPINDSMGCGGVMRAAPVGFTSLFGDTFELGARVAALTHGHPGGFLPAGFLARAVELVLAGETLNGALDGATASLRTYPEHEDTLDLVVRARDLGSKGVPSPLELERLGGGWVGHEALAISVACAVSAGDFEEGVLASVNHSGDSDSTGSIYGNLVGALWGVEAIPARWLSRVELRGVIKDLTSQVSDAWGPGASVAQSPSLGVRPPRVDGSGLSR
jgi:ADP-ribosylglycohydrolase